MVEKYHKTEEEFEKLEKRRKELRKDLTKVQGILIGGMLLGIFLWATGIDQWITVIIVFMAVIVASIFS